MERIFVQIPSYRDPELQSTLADLFFKAHFPERVRVGVYLQIIPDIDAECTFNIERHAQVCCQQVDARKSKGVCWARHELQKLWEGEEYSLQIDSHMRFIQGWDVRMIDILKRCPSENAVLSTYPPHYTPPSTLYHGYITGIQPSHFDEWGTLLLESQFIPENLAPKLPMAGVFCGACFLFGPSRIIEEIPYDPNLYFFGEEISLSARLWTSGWNVYHPNEVVLYHCWSREYRPTHWADVDQAGELDHVSRKRVNALLGVEKGDRSSLVEFGEYGLGASRSLRDFEKMSGVNFAQRTISPRNNSFLFPNNDEEPIEPFSW